MQLPYSTPLEEFGGLVVEKLHKAFYAWVGISELRLFQALTDFSRKRGPFVAKDKLRRCDQVMCQIDRVGDSFHSSHRFTTWAHYSSNCGHVKIDGKTIVSVLL